MWKRIVLPECLGGPISFNKLFVVRLLDLEDLSMLSDWFVGTRVERLKNGVVLFVCLFGS